MTSSETKSAHEVIWNERPSLHATDFHAWCTAQAALLDAGKLDAIEPLNIADEISDIASERFWALEDALIDLLTRTIQWDRGRRPGRVVEGLDPTRFRIRDMLDESPSIARRTATAMERAWEFAKLRAADEFDVEPESFPAVCPYTFDEIMARDFFAPADKA